MNKIKYGLFIDTIYAIQKKLQQAKDQQLKTILLAGFTGVGKSSVANRLCDVPLKINENGHLFVPPGKTAVAHIGHDSERSCTLYPELIPGLPGNYALFDTAGLMDERAAEQATESAIAACSIPLLLNTSEIHAICLLIPKEHLKTRTTFKNFKSTLEELGKIVDLTNLKVRNKFFFFLTKCDKDDDNDAKAVLIERLNATDKLKITVPPINIQAEHGNVFIMRHTDDDREHFLTQINSCNLARVSDSTTLKNTTAHYLKTAPTAYVRFGKFLYFANRYEGTCVKVPTFTEEIAKKLDTALNVESIPMDSFRSLSAKELSQITIWTGHALQEAIMAPLPAEAFPTPRAFTIESDWTYLRALVDEVKIDTTSLSEFEHSLIKTFQSALSRLIRELSWVAEKAIHPPNLEDLRGETLKNAALALLAFYAKNDVNDFNHSLKTCLDYMSRLHPIIDNCFTEIEQLTLLLQSITTEFNTLEKQPRPTAQMDQATILRHLGTVCKVATPETGANLHWHMLVRATTTESAKGLGSGSIPTLSHSPDDDVKIGSLLEPLLAFCQNYPLQEAAAITLPEYPLFKNVPQLYHALTEAVVLAEKTPLQTWDTPFFTAAQQQIMAFLEELERLATDPTAIFQKLLNEYYRCLNDIQTFQNRYINNYQTKHAKSIDLLAGSTAFITQYKNKSPQKSLQLPGGGTIDNAVSQQIHEALLAAEDLSLTDFTLGTETKTLGVDTLVLDGRKFAELLKSTTTSDDHMAMGLLPGQHLFSKTDSEWSLKVPLLANQKPVYQVTLSQNYDGFMVKVAIKKYWQKEYGTYRGDDTGIGTDHFITHFGEATRSPPYAVRFCGGSNEDGHYMYDKNHDYETQTATLTSAVKRAISDYCDIQIRGKSGQVFSWSDGQPVTVNTVKYDVILTDQDVITNATQSVNQWFITHRIKIAQQFNSHTTDSTSPSQQHDLLNQRKAALQQLDLLTDLIKILAKLVGKDMQASLFASLISSQQIQSNISLINHNADRCQLSDTLDNAIASQIRAVDIQAIPDDFNTRYLHPRTLLATLRRRIQTHLGWCKVNASRLVDPSTPSLPIDPEAFVKQLPLQSSRLVYANRPLSPSVLEYIRMQTHLYDLTLQHVGLTTLGDLLSVCTSVQTLNLSDNELSPEAWQDLTLFLACNTALKSLDIQVKPSHNHPALDDDTACNLLAALYLNRNLMNIVLHNQGLQSPFIKQLIEHLLNYKRTQAYQWHQSKEQDYFAPLDAEIETFLRENPHPISTLDTRQTLLGKTDTGTFLRSRIEVLKAQAKEQQKANPMTESISIPPRQKSAMSSTTKPQSFFFQSKATPTKLRIDLFNVNSFDPKGEAIPAQMQADLIFKDMQRRLQVSTEVKIGIIYFTNNEQALSLIAGYDQTQPNPITGSNLFRILFDLIQSARLCRRIHILPIATSVHDNSDDDSSNPITEAIMTRDILNIANHLKQDWQVLGLQNQTTAFGIFAIGNTSTHWSTSTLGKRTMACLQAMTAGNLDPLHYQTPEDNPATSTPS